MDLASSSAEPLSALSGKPPSHRRRVFARRSWPWPGELPTAAGAIVMAVGIFTLDALLHLPIPLGLIRQVLAVGLMVMWAYIAAAYLASWSRGTFGAHIAGPASSFAIGTWVAGTAVAGEVMLTVLPDSRLLVEALGLLAVLLWLWFMTVVLRTVRVILVHQITWPANGSILLSTVSTQSIVILAVSLFPGQIPGRMLAALILLGVLLYALGTALIAHHYLWQRTWRLGDEWDNTNCILHGAGSITGLAAILSGALSHVWILGAWLWTAGMLLLVEGIELARAWHRVREYGWTDGLLRYDVSQWARVFTLGMFYAFTVHLPVQPLDHATLSWLASLRLAIVGSGQYVVLAVLLAEIALGMKGNIRHAQRREAQAQPGGEIAGDGPESGA